MRKSSGLRKIVSMFMVLALVLSSAVICAVQTVAATASNGNGGTAYAGAGTNTFAADMPLTEIYFVAKPFESDPYSVEITSGKDTLLKLYGKKVQILGSALEHNSLTNGFGTDTKKAIYVSTYKDAAILPDGTVKDVVIQFEVTSVMTAKYATGTASTDNVPLPGATTIHNNHHNDKGVSLSTATSGGTGIDNTFFGISVEQKIIITVDGAGEFVVPFYGYNQNRSSAGSYRALKNVHQNGVGYNASIETLKLEDSSNIFYPANTDSYRTTETITEGGTQKVLFVQRGGTEEMYNSNGGGSAGGDGDGYVSGFATVGQSGFTATSIAPCGQNADSSFANNEYIALGDLIHRIWSGSGEGGKIETGKSGSGTDLPGGSFTGEIPFGFPEPSDPTAGDTLRRYVVPDAKSGVTYTMTPESGYILDRIVVDGYVYEGPNELPATEQTITLASSDGNGTITYSPSGVCTYKFDNANIKDHEIYVTWKKPPTGIDKETYGAKGDAQKGTPTFEKGTEDIPTTGAYTLIDENGDPQTSITIDGEGTYTINSDTGEVTFVPDPNFDGPRGTGVTVQVTDSKGMTATAKYTPNIVDNEETVTKTQKVEYVYEDGSPVLDNSGNPLVKERSKTYTRKGTVDSDTGVVTYPDWTEQSLDEVDSPDITDYTPDKEKVDGGSYTPDNWPDDEVVTYTKNPLPPTGEDDETYGGKGETQTGKPEFTKGSGDIPETGAYTLLDEDGNPVDSITVDGEGTYTIDPDTGEVTFKPEPDFVGDAKGVTVQVTDGNGLTAKATYTPHVVDDEQSSTAKRTITYFYDDGTPVLDENGDPLISVEEKTFTRTGTVDHETGKITWNSWNEENFSEVESPEVQGYTPDKAETPTEEAHPGDDISERVIYLKNHDIQETEEKTITRVIKYRYIDENGEEAFADVNQVMRFSRVKTTDPVTGEVTYGNWIPDKDILEEVKSPTITGCTVDKESIGSLTIDPNAYKDGEEIVEFVIYTKNSESKPEPKPETIWVTYVDTDGTTIYLEKTTVVKASEGETQQEPNAPKNPTKDGYTFKGWTRTVDEAGNITYTAIWEEIKPEPTPTSKPQPEPQPDSDPQPEPKTIWVTYIDSDGSVYKVKTDFAKGNAEPPAPVAPTKNGYIFKGWDRSVDAEGNITYIAKWEEVKPEPKKEPEIATGDKSDMVIWVGSFIFAAIGALAITYNHKRARRVRAR
ncbi:MAG: InlB B-repeat-containing protein [Firmicutes bacterium]|nr:InlB B-repeat-containing protein [Bacillota bacterium]